MPFFSIIVVSYNAEKLIKKTIESTLSQTFTDYEIIVKDAVSKDNTLKEIPEDSRIKVYSQPDTGIYDGMNQAVNFSTGTYLIFMNCGDLFYSKNVLGAVYEKIKKEGCGNDSIVYGNYHTRGNVVIQPRVLTKKFLNRKPLCHQSVFFGGNLIRSKAYDTSLKIYADYDLTHYFFSKNIKFIYIDEIICEYEGGGFSTKEENSKLIHQEERRILKKYASGKERFYRFVKSVVTLQKLRVLIASEKSPEFLRKIYSNFANKVNK